MIYDIMQFYLQEWVAGMCIILMLVFAFFIGWNAVPVGLVATLVYAPIVHWIGWWGLMAGTLLIVLAYVLWVLWLNRPMDHLITVSEDGRTGTYKGRRYPVIVVNSGGSCEGPCIVSGLTYTEDGEIDHTYRFHPWGYKHR